MTTFLSENDPSPQLKDRDKWVKRLDELRRARAAHLSQMIKKTSNKPRPRPSTYPDVSTCSVCEKTTTKGKTAMCPTCLVLALSTGGETIQSYCSQECANPAWVRPP